MMVMLRIAAKRMSGTWSRDAMTGKIPETHHEQLSNCTEDDWAVFGYMKFSGRSFVECIGH